MTTTERPERRSEALSKDRIVHAAIEILDADGEGGLTFRSLAGRLSTGAGAIYHHVANKDELLAATTDEVIAGVMADVVRSPEPQETIRAVALGVFDAIDEHPWVGAQLSREPWQPALLRILEGMGAELEPLGVPEEAQFNSATALLNYVLGLAGQYAAGARLHVTLTSRTDALTAVATGWLQLDPADYPFVRRLATQLPEHDDREQFLAGIDLILAGIDSVTSSSAYSSMSLVEKLAQAARVKTTR